MEKTDPRVDAFLAGEERWREAFAELRAAVRACGLTETLKWGVPCYTVQDENVVLIHGFKDYCALLFVRGALLSDPAGILVRQTENVQAARQIRFRDADSVRTLAPTIGAYVREAVAQVRAGMKVERKSGDDAAYPEELARRFRGDPSLKDAFERLTPGRRRAYLLHFTAPKQEKTRESRIEKALPAIRAGRGLDD
ncbi:MAG: DUF1801 domain-containing protein [Candidatus Izemoplasmatales bacterium]